MICGPSLGLFLPRDATESVLRIECIMDTFGKNFRISVFGESHGDGIGVVIDGVPAGLVLSEDDFSIDLSRRKSGAKGTTPRKEDDKPQILSGIMAGHTTGAPIAVLFRNSNTRSSDYSMFRGKSPVPAMLISWQESNGMISTTPGEADISPEGSLWLLSQPAQWPKGYCILL